MRVTTGAIGQLGRAVVTQLAKRVVAERIGVPARLIERAADIDWEWLGQPGTVGITAGASAPEVLVREVVDALCTRFDIIEEVVDHTPERMIFKLPRELVA